MARFEAKFTIDGEQEEEHSFFEVTLLKVKQ